MKPLTQCLAAGAFAALALFGYTERFAIRSLFSTDAQTKQVVAVKAKATVYTPSGNQSEKNASVLTGSISPKSIQMPAVAAGKKQPANQPAILSNETTASVDYLSGIVIHSDNRVVIKENIDISKLANEMPDRTGSVSVKTVAPATDSISLQNNLAITGRQTTESEVYGQEKPETVIAQPKKMAGTAYEGPALTTSFNVPAYNRTANKAVNRSEKAGQKNTGSNMLAAFAAVSKADNGTDTYSYASLSEDTEQLLEFAERTGSNTDFGIIVNLGIKSGKKRFFVVDLSSNTIVKSGIVAEGSGSVYGDYEKKYSNDMGSMATSLGVYKIGKPVKAGLSYQLLGMQESNSNAAKRSMLLQASEEVPYDEIAFPLLKTNGSLSLSGRFLKEISPLLTDSAKPVLLWVCDPAAESQSLYSKK